MQRLKSLLQAAGLPVHAPALDPSDSAERYIALMRLDKKAEAGDIRFVLLRTLGQAVVAPAPQALVREVIEACSG